MPAYQLKFDDVFTAIEAYARLADEDTALFFKELMAFKAHALTTNCSEINRYLRQNALSDMDKARIAERVTDLSTHIEHLLNLANDYTLTRSIKEDIQLTLTYVREQLEQTQAQVWYKPDPSSQTLPQSQQALLQDAVAKALYDQTLKAIQDHYHNLGYKFTCFISYAWPLEDKQKLLQQDESGVQDFLRQLRLDLRQAGIHALLDIVDNEAGNNIYQFMARANSSDYVLLIGTESLLKKHQQGLSAVCSELVEIKRKRLADKTLGLPPTVYPLLLSGKAWHSFPPEELLYSAIREWPKKTYVANIKELIRTLYRASQQNPDYQNLWQAFTEQHRSYLSIQDTAAFYRPQPTADLSFHHNLPRRNPQFVGREGMLQALETSLDSMQFGVITQAVKGLGGVGKTQLALEYAHSSVIAGKYHLVWWLDASNITVGYLALADHLAIPKGLKPEERIAIAKHKLAEQGRWLLVFDNAASYDSIKAELPAMPGHVLVTSRYSQDWEQCLSLGVFSKTESLVFLTKLLWDENQPASEAFKQVALELAALLGHLPLALAQAGAYIKQTGCAIADYINLFKEQRQALWQEETPPTDYPSTVAVTWNISFKAAKTEVGEVRVPLLDKLVEHFAYIHTEAPRWLLATLLDSQLDFNAVIGALNVYSLITLDKNLTMHQLVQQVVKDKSTVTAEQVAGWLSFVSPQDDTTQALEQQKDLLPHYQVVETRVKHVHSDIIASFLTIAGTAYWHFGQTATAAAYVTRALAIKEVLYGKDHPEMAITLNSLANIYGDLGDSRQKKCLTERALSILEAHYGKEHPQVAIVLTNLASAYGDLGDIRQKKYIMERALSIFEAHLGKNHPETASALNNLARAYGDLGDIQQKKNLLERALAIKETHYGKSHPKTASTLTNLANAYGALGDVRKKKSLLKQALAIQEAHYDKNHPYIAITLNCLANAYAVLGKTQQRKHRLERALLILETYYRQDHPDIAITLFNLADVYDGQQQQALLERALNIQEKHYGKNHLEVARILSKLSIAFFEQDELPAAIAAITRAQTIAKHHTHLNSFHPIVQLIQQVVDTIYSAVNKTPSPNQHAEQIILGLFAPAPKLPLDLMARCKISDVTVTSLAKGLRMAACNNYLEDLKHLIPLVDDINIPDDNPKSKRTALHWAVERENKACIGLLLKHGADASLVDAQGQSPLSIARTKGDAELISLLNANVPKSAGPG